MSIPTIKALKIKIHDTNVTLQKLTMEDFSMLLPKDFTGVPKYFTIKRGAFKLWPLSKIPFHMEIVYD